MKTLAATVRDSGEGEQRWFCGGGMHTWLATSEETGGAFLLFEFVGEQGKVTPVHIHPASDETFYILDGEILLDLDGRTARALRRRGGGDPPRRAARVHGHLAPDPDPDDPDPGHRRGVLPARQRTGARPAACRSPSTSTGSDAARRRVRSRSSDRRRSSLPFVSCAGSSSRPTRPRRTTRPASLPAGSRAGLARWARRPPSWASAGGRRAACRVQLRPASSRRVGGPWRSPRPVPRVFLHWRLRKCDYGEAARRAARAGARGCDRSRCISPGVPEW